MPYGLRCSCRSDYGDSSCAVIRILLGKPISVSSRGQLLRCQPHLFGTPSSRALIPSWNPSSLPEHRQCSDGLWMKKFASFPPLPAPSNTAARRGFPQGRLSSEHSTIPPVSCPTGTCCCFSPFMLFSLPEAAFCTTRMCTFLFASNDKGGRKEGGHVRCSSALSFFPPDNDPDGYKCGHL